MKYLGIALYIWGFLINKYHIEDDTELLEIWPDASYYINELPVRMRLGNIIGVGVPKTEEIINLNLERFGLNGVLYFAGHFGRGHNIFIYSPSTWTTRLKET